MTALRPALSLAAYHSRLQKASPSCQPLWHPPSLTRFCQSTASYVHQTAPAFSLPTHGVFSILMEDYYSADLNATDFIASRQVQSRQHLSAPHLSVIDPPSCWAHHPLLTTRHPTGPDRRSPPPSGTIVSYIQALALPSNFVSIWISPKLLTATYAAHVLSANKLRDHLANANLSGSVPPHLSSESMWTLPDQ